MSKANFKVSHGLVLELYKVQKKCEKSLGEKSCEIKGGSQEMAAMMLMKIMQPLLKFTFIDIIAAISSLPHHPSL